MATFVLAAVCIGLVLLGHEHCSAAELGGEAEAGSGHEGHAH